MTDIYSEVMIKERSRRSGSDASKTDHKSEDELGKPVRDRARHRKREEGKDEGLKPHLCDHRQELS